MRFLYCLFPLSGHDGYSVVAEDLLTSLVDLGHEVDTAVLAEGWDPRRDWEAAGEPLRKLSHGHFIYRQPIGRSGPRRLLHRLRRRLLPRRQGGMHFCPPGFYRALARRFDLRAYDAAVAATARFSRLAELVSCPAIVDLHEVFTHKAKTLRRLGITCLSPYLGLAEELSAMRSFDLVWCPSSWSRRILGRLLPGKRLLDRQITYRSLTPEGYTPPKPRTSGPPRILFAGSTAGENVPGLTLFLGRIFPLIRRAIPSVEFHVVGWRESDFPAGADLRNLVPHGRLPTRDEVLRVFAETDVVVIPRLLGGLTVKGMEALCLGKAAVGHPAAFSGCYRIESWVHAVVAPGDREFADAVVRLLRDPAQRERIGRNAWEFTRVEFTPARAYQGLFEALEEAGHRGAKTSQPKPKVQSPKPAGGVACDAPAKEGAFG
jgi:glycosyltransferase involved in cell wall biosynthesis